MTSWRERIIDLAGVTAIRTARMAALASR